MPASIHHERVCADSQAIREDRQDSTSNFNSMLSPCVVAEIFLLVKEAQDTTTDFNSLPVPFILGSVCKTWRDTVWNDTRLWDTIVIRLSPDKLSVQEGLLRDWLTRAGPCRPLRFYIGFKNEDLTWKPPLSFATLILDTSSRWRVFECLQNISALSKGLENPGREFPLLTDMKIYHSPCFKMDFQRAVQMRRLVITKGWQKIHTMTLLINWGQLTSLDIVDEVAFDVVVKIMQNLVSIQHLSLCPTIWPSSTGGTIQVSPPPHQKLLFLSHLTLHGTSRYPQLIIALLDALTAPALTHIAFFLARELGRRRTVDDANIKVLSSALQVSFTNLVHRSLFTLRKCWVSYPNRWIYNGHRQELEVMSSHIASVSGLLISATPTTKIDPGFNGFHMVEMHKV